MKQYRVYTKAGEYVGQSSGTDGKQAVRNFFGDDINTSDFRCYTILNTENLKYYEDAEIVFEE